MHGGDGLVITKNVRICNYFTCSNAKCDNLNDMCYLNSSYMYSLCEN